jgi:hypothetical protein
MTGIGTPGSRGTRRRRDLDGRRGEMEETLNLTESRTPVQASSTSRARRGWTGPPEEGGTPWLRDCLRP